MENPVYKLEKVVRTRTEEMQDFEGPLDLILFLLSKNKMEIQDISVALICDQYVAWLQQRRQMRLLVLQGLQQQQGQRRLAREQLAWGQQQTAAPHYHRS